MINLANKWVALTIIGCAFAFAFMIAMVAYSESSKYDNKPYVIQKDGKDVICIYEQTDWKCE